MSALAFNLAADARRRFGIIAWAAASNRASEARRRGDMAGARQWAAVADLVAHAHT